MFILSKKRSTTKSQNFKYIEIEYGGGGVVGPLVLERAMDGDS